MSDLLSSQAPAAHRELPPFLHAKIMAGIRRTDSEAGTFVLRPRWARGASVALALTATWFVIHHRGARDEARPEFVATRATHITSPSLPGIPRVDLADLDNRLEQPFAEEANAVIADARSAIQLLAQNFVPAEWQMGMRIGDEGLRP